MFYYILIATKGSNRGKKKEPKKFDFMNLKDWWLVRSDKEIEFGSDGELILGVDGFCHFQYLYLFLPNSPIWTIGKFCGTRCIYKFTDEFQAIEFIKQEVHKNQEKANKRMNKYIDAILQNI